MCLGAIVGSGIEGLVYSACRYEFFKSKESSFDLAFKLGRFLKTKKGILAFESSKLLKEFFCDLRNQQSQTLKVYKNKIKEKKKYE